MTDYKFRDETLGVDERVRALLAELTLEEKLTLLSTRQGAIERLGVGKNRIGAEVARGFVGRNPDEVSTVFPEPFGLAATFDPAIMRTMGEITGTEARIYANKGKGSRFVWGPTVDLERDPRWGRTEEGYGEDPYLTGVMASELCRGMRGVSKSGAMVIPTLKHFYANNHEENRMSDNAMIPPRLKHEYYLKAFERPIRDGGALSLMTAYNEINGIEGCVNPEIDKLCRSEWGLLFAVTDGGDFIQNVQAHKRDRTHCEAFARIYGSHGADIMTDDEGVVRDAARQALEKGLVTERDIDKALFGVLKARFLLGEFDKTGYFDSIKEELLCCEEHKRVAQKAAEESVILLKNSRNVLPLSKDARVALIGWQADMICRDWYTGIAPENPTILEVFRTELGEDNVRYDSGNDIVTLRSADNGFYFSVDDDGVLNCDCAVIGEECLFELYEWGDGAISLRSRKTGRFVNDNGILRCDSEEVYGWYVKELFYLEKVSRDCCLKNWQKRYVRIGSDRKMSVCEAIRRPAGSLIHIDLFSSGVDRVKRIASEHSNTVVFGGNNPEIGARECTDRRSLTLPEKQTELLDAALKVNQNTVLCLVSGYPYAVNDERVTSIMHITHAGPALGIALYRNLYGEISPAGRCPMTWYASENELCDIRDYNIIRTGMTYQYYEGKPLYPFGYGMSYSVFHYSRLTTDKQSYEKGEVIRVSFELENIGTREADEVVQLYVVPPRLPITLPKKQLKGFRRVTVPRGETVVVELELPVDELSFWDINNGCMEVFSGEYELEIGASSADIRRSAVVHINAADFPGADVSKPFLAINSTDYLGVVFDADENLEEYALINDWQSHITYESCMMNGFCGVEVTASNCGAACMLTITCPDINRVIAQVEIPATGSYTAFGVFTAEAQAVSGIHPLRISASGCVSLKSFRFY